MKAGKTKYPPIEIASDSDNGEHEIKIGQIAPKNRDAFRYDGSLTTPPYSENVTFVIFKHPVSATKFQLRSKGAPNARALQPTNRRYCVSGKVK